MLVNRLLMLILVCLASVNISYAQQTPEANSDEQRQTQDQEKERLEKEAAEKAAQKKAAEQQAKKEETRKPKTPRKVFKPTEEISEDSPVPFPVDI